MRRFGPLLVLLALTATSCSDSAPRTTTPTEQAPVDRATPTEPVRRTFTVADGQILEGGIPFVPTGVNILGPHSMWPFATKGRSGAIADLWRLNTVRVNTCLPGGCQNARGAVHSVNDDLDGIVQEYSAAGLVVIISQHLTTPGEFPDPKAATALEAWWSATARRYAGDDAVWFNLLNEPGSSRPPDPRWLDIHERLRRAVRATGATNLIVMDGTQWGQEAGIKTAGPVTAETSAILRFGPTVRVADERVVFSVHVYDQWGDAVDESSAARLASFVAAIRATGAAVIFGETGGPADERDERLVRATRAAYEVATAHDVGILAWHATPGDGYALTTAGAIDQVDHPDQPTNLTWHGRLLWDLARQRSPTGGTRSRLHIPYRYHHGASTACAAADRLVAGCTAARRQSHRRRVG